MNRLRAQLTMVAAVILFFGGTAYGVKLLTRPADTSGNGPTCDARTVAAGQNLTTNLIKVNVFNASQRSGLANKVNIALQRKGFLGGRIGNSTSGITTKKVVIVTSDKTDPQVKLLAAQFKDKPDYVAPKSDDGTDMTVVVGDDYRGLVKKAPRSVKSDRRLDFCLPIVTVN